MLSLTKLQFLHRCTCKQENMNYVFKIQLLTHFKIFIEKTHWSHVVQQMILFPWRLRLLNALETSLQPLYHSTTAASSTSHTPAKTIAQLDSMRWFSHQRSPSPLGGHTMVSSVAACCIRPTAHALLCTINGDDSAVFRFFCPRWPDLWPWHSNSGDIFVQCT